MLNTGSKNQPGRSYQPIAYIHCNTCLLYFYLYFLNLSQFGVTYTKVTVMIFFTFAKCGTGVQYERILVENIFKYN